MMPEGKRSAQAEADQAHWGETRRGSSAERPGRRPRRGGPKQAPDSSRPITLRPAEACCVTQVRDIHEIKGLGSP